MRSKLTFWGFFVVFLFRLGAAGSSFALSFLIALYLTVDQAGAYFWALSCITVLGVIARLGLDYTIVRRVGYYCGDMNQKTQMAFMLRVFFLAFLGIAFFYIGIFFLLQSNVFVKVSVLNLNLFKIMMLAFPCFVITPLIAMWLQGLGYSNLSILYMNLLVFSLLCGYIFVFDIQSSIVLVKTHVWILYGVMSVAIVSLIKVYSNATGVVGVTTESVSFRAIFISSMPLWVVAISQQVTMFLGQIVSGFYLPPDQIALVAVAQRTALVISLVLLSINTIIAPKMSKLYGSGQVDKANVVYKTSMKLSALLSLPLVLICLLFPNEILSIFGEQYVAGAILLVIFALGQFINSLTGSVGFALTMSGNERLLAKSTISGGLLAIVLAFTFIPLYGAVGAAISTAIAISLQNGYAYYLFRQWQNKM